MDRKVRINPKLIIFILLAVFFISGFDSRLKIRYYTVDSEKIQNPLRIALISDLHSCKYGESQRQLLESLERQNPDLVMLAGDIFDDVLPDNNTEDFLKGLDSKYTVFYVTGNHEFWSGETAFFRKMEILEKYNVPMLSGETSEMEIKGEALSICGVDDPDAYMLFSGKDNYKTFTEQIYYVKELAKNNNYTILLSHRPEHFELYVQNGFDLVLSGHAHGGQWRIPLLLNGFFAPNQGFFPKYAGGKYEELGTTMVVSRGLARESTRIPRFFNPPELVIIDLV